MFAFANTYTNPDVLAVTDAQPVPYAEPNLFAVTNT